MHVTNRFSHFCKVDELSSQEVNVNDTIHDTDYEFSDLEYDLDILEFNSGNCPNVTNYNNFDKVLLKKQVDQKLVLQAWSCLEYIACKEQMGNAFCVLPLSPLMLYQGPKTNHTCISDILTHHRAMRDSNYPNFISIRISVASKLKIKNWKYYLANYWDKPLTDLFLIAVY